MGCYLVVECLLGMQRTGADFYYHKEEERGWLKINKYIYEMHLILSLDKT